MRQKRRHREDLLIRERNPTPHECGEPASDLNGCLLPDLLQPSEATLEARGELAARPHTSWRSERLPAPKRAAHLAAAQNRHRSSENWHHRHVVAHLLHGVPLHPQTTGLAGNRRKGARRRRERSAAHLPLGEWEGSVALARSSPRAPLSQPWPSSVPLGGVVRKIDQSHCDAQTFMAQELSESSLPPSSGSRGAVDIQCQQRKAAC